MSLHFEIVFISLWLLCFCDSAKNGLSLSRAHVFFLCIRNDRLVKDARREEKCVLEEFLQSEFSRASDKNNPTSDNHELCAEQ